MWREGWRGAEKICIRGFRLGSDTNWAVQLLSITKRCPCNILYRVPKFENRKYLEEKF